MAKEQTDDVAIQVGLLLGAEWTVADIATHLGMTPQNIYAMKKRLRTNDVIERVKGWQSVAISKYIERRIAKKEQEIQERKERLLSKGYEVLEKTVDHTLKAAELAEENDAPWTPKAEQLAAANMGIERSEGKPLDRKAILERRETIHTVQVDGGDLEQVLREAAMLNEMRRKALPAAVLEAELVEREDS